MPRQLRLPNYDYSTPGWYFITACTRRREPYFGEVRNGIVGLSRVGAFAHRCWCDIPEHYPSVRIDAFIVMPDHLHGLICLEPISDRDAKRPTLLSVVGSFKAAVSYHARSYDEPFAWQRRFHDTLVRSYNGLKAIRRYIENNPSAWETTPHPAI